jgi:GNAT superfamily N-acetyltransferase
LLIRAVRAEHAGDRAFLEEMWHTAAFWQPEVFSIPADQALRIPEIAAYITGFGRDGDVGLIAESDGRPAGAAWYRRFTSDAPGYGFVDEATPELAIAVVAHARGRGIATALLAALIEDARRREVPALSLSVNHTNPSRRIYERAGFAEVSSDQDSSVMLLRL